VRVQYIAVVALAADENIVELPKVYFLLVKTVFSISFFSSTLIPYFFRPMSETILRHQAHA